MASAPLVDTQFLTQASGQDEDGEEGEPEDGGRRWARRRRKKGAQVCGARAQAGTNLGVLELFTV